VLRGQGSPKQNYSTCGSAKREAMSKVNNQVDYALKKRLDKQDKMVKISRYLKDLSEEGFTGYIKLNFSQGGIGRIEKFEEVLKN
jgi:hypothetical protein